MVHPVHGVSTSIKHVDLFLQQYKLDLAVPLNTFYDEYRKNMDRLHQYLPDSEQGWIGDSDYRCETFCHRIYSETMKATKQHALNWEFKLGYGINVFSSMEVTSGAYAVFENTTKLVDALVLCTIGKDKQTGNIKTKTTVVHCLDDYGNTSPEFKDGNATPIEVKEDGNATHAQVNSKVD
jgi:hypothetical protein